MNQESSPAHALPDKHQSAWHLASIQMAGWTSLPILATSIVILQRNSLLGAILTIIVGNAILWFVRLVIIAMSYMKRQSTLDVARDYFGRIGSYFIALLLLGSTLFWFVAQTTTGSNSLAHLLHIEESVNINQFMQISVLLGTVSTLFCMGGIVLLRKLSTFAFPILIVAFILILFALPESSLFSTNHPFSFAGLTLVLTTNLGITADLPTFFRHSGSWQTSVKALTIVQVLSIALGIGGLFWGSIISHGLEIDQESIRSANHLVLKIPLICFILLSVICTNVANVYSASVGWELVAPKNFVGRKEYFILGLGLTTIFILITGLFSIDLFLQTFDSSLVNLCIVLIIGYYIKGRRYKLPNQFEQTSYFVAWLLSSIVNALQYSQILLINYSTLIASVCVILLAVLPSVILYREK